MPEDTLASVGSSKRFECRVIGYPIPRITWLKDDVNIGRSDRFKFDYSVDGLVTMEIENVTYADVGSYQCLAVNSEGWASTTAHLKVKGIGTDNTDDTMTVYRMTFDNSGTRKDSSKRPLVISDTAIDDTNGDIMGVDALNRTLSPGGVRQLDITGSLDNAISLKEDNYKTFLGDNANQSIENNLEQNADKRLNCDVGLSRADLKKIENGEHVSRDVVPRDSVDIDENDSGVSSHFSSSSSVNKKQANDSNKKDDKITISVIEEDLIKETNAMKRENVVDDLVGFLKADDRSNRSRRLTNDSGIADDDYSSLSSEEDVDNTGNKRRRSSAKDGVQNKIQKPHDIDKSNTDINTCHPNVSEISVISDNNLNQIENIQNVPDSITERLQAEKNGDRLTKPKIKNKDSSATNEIQEDSNELTDFGNSELETAENVQMLCISDSMESCIENEITTHQPLLDKRTANDQTMDGLNNNDDNLISAMNVQKMDPVVQNNAKGDLDTSTEMDDSLLSGKTQKVDQLTTNANGDLDKSQKMDDSLLSGKTQEVDQLTPNANGDLDKSKKMGDSLLQGKTHEVDPLTTKKPDQRNIENIDKLDENERDSSDGDLHDDEMFHSDEEEHKILAEIRPNNRVQKIIHDETRSNTLSFQSMESWSIYESCDDYTLSESNFDTISYQNIDDDEFFMARHDSKSEKGDSRSTKEEKYGDQDNIYNTDDVDAPVDENMERVKNDAVQNKMKVNTVECLSKDATKDVACDATQNTSINTDSNGEDKNRNSNNMDHSNDEIKNRQEIDHNGDQVMGTTGESAANARLESSHLKDSKEIDTHADQTGNLDQQNDKNRDSGQNGKGIKTDDGQSPNDDRNVDRDSGSSLDGQSPNDDRNVDRDNGSSLDDQSPNDNRNVDRDNGSSLDGQIPNDNRNVDRDNGSSLDGQSPNDNRNVDRDNGSSLDGQSPNDDRNVDRGNGSSLDGQSPNDDRNVDRGNGSSLDGQSPNDDRNVDRDNGSSLDGQSPNDDRNVDRNNGSSLERNKDKKVDGQFENNNSTPTKPKFMDELEKHTNITLDDHEFRWESDDSLCRDTGNAKLKARNNVDKIYYSSDEYFDDESDLSVEDIEEEKCDILQKLDLSSYVINDSGKKQLTTLDEMSSTESSDHNENESESKDAISKNKTKSDGKNDVNSAIGVNKDKNNSKPAMRKLEYLHSMSKYDDVSDESGNLEKISDTRPALPNTLFLKDQESIARMMDRVASETNTQLQLSPELEDGEFDEFVNLLTVIPGKDVRPLLSPIVEEGPVSHTSDSIETTSSSSPEDNNKPVVAKKTKRPSLIDLIVTDTDGSVEQINLEKMDALQSFSEPHYVTVPNGNTEQDGIPRIIKGPSSVTAMDGGEIVLKWNILGCPEPEVAVFKDGDSLQLCDEITLNKEETTWTLTIQDVIKEDAGLYEICAVNSIGNDILKTRVYVKTVNRAPVDNDETDTLNRQEGEKVVPNFLKSPKDLEVKEGEVTLVECQILGDPHPQVVWLKDEEPIYPDERVEILQDDAKCQLIIKPTTQEDAGTYTCRASNSVGVNQVQFSVEVANNAENKVKVDNNEDSKNIPQITWNSGNDQDHVDEPSAPVVQLDMSESDECFSRKFRIVSDYHDEFNDVDLIEGEITEVLDRSKQTHWLVRSLKDPTKVCYVPTYLLENTKDENVSRVIQGRNEKNPVAAAEIQNKTKKIMTELIESETDYICDLKDLIDTYKSPIDEGEITPTVVDKQSGVLNTLTQLYQFHKETLLPNLIENSEDAESVGDIFSQKRASFSEYVPFCSEHDKAMDSTDVDQMQALMEAFSLIMGDPDTAFEDLMNRPLDRIHEYIEILKTLIKLTAQTGGDCSGLMAAVQMLSEICRTMEDIVLLDRIEGYQGDVKELGPVLKHEDVVQVEEQKDTDSEGQGHIESEGQRPRESEGQRHVILFPDKIMVTKPMTSDPKGKLEFEKIIELKDVSIRKQVETTDDGACTIELWEDVTSQDLSASSPSLKLHVQDLHTKQTWVRDIQEAKKKLELKNTETDTMPEFRQKLKGKKLTSTPKKRVVKNVDTVEIESDRSSDDFNILGTRKDLQGDRYVAAEFEDGTTRPIFRRKLQKTIVGETSTAKLECEVAGIPQPKVLWLKNNRPLVESDHCKVISDGAVHTLEFTDTRKEDTGLYTARAMNVNGSTISTAELYIGEVQPTLLNKYKEGLSDSKYQTPAYFFQMNSCQVEEGRLARFDCRVVAYPKPDIVWMKDGKVVEPNDRYKLLNFNNEIYSLLIQNVVKGDMGRYTCWAHNKYGEAMTEAYLNVIAFQDQQDEGDMAPQFLTRFYDQTLTEGVPAELQCLIDGRPMPTIKWLFNDIEIIPSDNLAILQDKNLCSLCIKEVTQKDLGTYTCNLKNALGVASCSAGLNVLNEKIKNVPVLPKFLKKISDQNMRTGEGVTFEVVVIGEPPPKVVWLFNHKPISDARRRFKITQDGDVYKLTIEDLILDDDGKITCKATNSEGEVYSSGNLLVRETRKVSEQPDEQKFTQKDFDAKYGYLPTFMKKIDDILVPSGKDGKFECRIMGIPEPTVTWKKNGQPITSDGRHWMSQDGGCCFLTIRGATDRDQGVYTCTIANAAGENSCTAYMRLSEAKKPGEYFERESSLTSGRRGSVGRGEVPTMPYEKPTISDVRPESTRLTWQPVLTSALSSDSKNIKYIIEGRELPDAEWKKMASGIHGNTHMLRNLRPQKEYDFRVRAENQFGLSDSTQPATLERPKPEIDEFVTSMKSKVTQFRRPPELPRSKPLIADMGAESVKLAWQPAVVSPAIKKPPPVTYRLEAQELPASDWLPLSSRLSDTSHYLSDLLPDRDYNIRVRAENKYGLSEPTEPIWIPRAKAFPGVPIARPEIIEMEPNMVKLRWERVDVPSFSADDQSLRYMIEMQTPPAREWSSVARDIAGTVYVVSDLEPGQDYRFRVRARTPLGVMSEPSPVTSIYRTIATTVAPIDSLELEDEEDVDFDGIRLRWNRVQIPPYTAGEEPLLYMIEMNEPPLDEWRPIISGLPTTRYRVSDLVPDRDYHFRVRALSSYGMSPPSYTLPVSYRRPLPGPSRILPEYPRIVYDESDALQLSWQPPKISTPIKEPIKYRVELQAPPSLSWKPLATGIPDTRYPIRGLGPSRDYMFRVVPETSTGLLEPLPPVSLTSLPAPRTFLPSRPEILDYEPDSLMLSWRRPYVDTHLPVMYRIDVQEPPSLDWRPLMSDVTDTSYRVTGLRPSRDYSFRIVPYSGTDHWEPLPPVTLTSLPVKPRFIPHEPTITPIGADSVKLSWKPADIPMYPRRPVPISYIVEMRTRPGYDWTPMARNVMNTSYIIKGLNPSKEYQFRVSPQTDYGIGEPTMPATFYRKPVPLVRHEPVVSNIYGDSVLLSWQPAEFKGDFKFPPSVTYSIEIQDRPGVGPWTPFITGIQGTSYHVTGLHPDREYFFRVRGHAGDVFGEPSAPVYLTHRAGPPRIPQEQPYISELSPNSVHLQWRAVQLPSRITDYAPVSYRLEIQELPRSDWVILADGIPHTDFHVINLLPDKEYNFRVRAVNKYGCSEPTSLVQLRRRAIPPKMPKDEPLIYDIGHGSLMLSWRPADVPYYLDEKPVTYTIYVQDPPSTTWRPLYRRIPYTSYHVTNLQPDRDYCFRVQAENIYGLSQPTNAVRLTRLSDFRSPIDIPEITDFDETRSSLQLRWTPRKMTPFDKTPLKYHIESWEPIKRTWRRLATDIPDTSYRLTGLSPENDYILRVRAQAESILSEPSYPVSTNRYRGRVPITRPQLFDVESDSVRLSWQPYPGTATPRRYKLELRESSARDWRSVTTDVYGTTHKVTGLKPKQDYQFRLRGVMDQGQTDYVYSVPLHRRTVVPRLPLAGIDIVNVEDDYVDLSWKMVDVPAFSSDEKPLAFLIEAQQLPRYDWLPVASGISDTGYRVKGLQRNQDYTFRLRGEYPSGLSQPSQHVSVYRRPIRPGVPISRPEIFDDEPNSARLRWQRVYTPPYHHHSEPLSYQIELQEAPYRNWRPLARGITMTEHTITDLMPKKDYLFRIRAETPNGDISAPTPPIAYYKSHSDGVDSENQNVEINNKSPSKDNNEMNYTSHSKDNFEMDYTSHSKVKCAMNNTSHSKDNFEMDYASHSKDNFEIDYASPSKDKYEKNYASHAKDNYEMDYTSHSKDKFDMNYASPTKSKFEKNYALHAKDNYEMDYTSHSKDNFEIDYASPSKDKYEKNYASHAKDNYEMDYTSHSKDKFDMNYASPTKSKFEKNYALHAKDNYEMDYTSPTKHNYDFDDFEMNNISPKKENTRISQYTDNYSFLDSNKNQLCRIDDILKKRPHTLDKISDTLPMYSNKNKKDRLRKYDAEMSRNVQDYLPYKSDSDDSDFGVPSPRTPRKTVDYKMLEQDFSVPTRSYIDHLTTFIPPRLPLDKPDMTEDDQSTVSLRWRPALVPDRARDKYPVTYSIEVKNPPNLEWRDIETGLTGLSHTLKNIHPEFDYMFRIRAHNEFGSSEATLPVSLYRPIEIEQYYDSEYDEDYEYPLVTLGDCVPPKLPMETPKMTNITGERAMLHWLPARIPAYAKKVPITYIVEIKEDNMPGFSRFQSGLTDTKFYIEGLNPSQSYQFRVKAETQFGCSDPTLAVVLDRNKEEENTPILLEDVRNLIDTMQDKVKRPSTDIRRDDLDIPQAKMREVIPSGVPPRMSSSRPLITNRYGGNLSLTWGPGRVPSYVKGSTMTYIVEKREPPQTNWTILADNLLDNDYDVSGLSSDRDYMFRVRAKNQFGTSDPTMPCSVINVKDDYVPPVFSRSQSRDSGTPRILSRRSSIESPLSLSRQMSLDENDDTYRSAMPPEFKSITEETQYGVLGKTAKVSLAVRGFPLPLIEWTYKGDNLCDMNKYKSFISPSGVITLEIFDFRMTDVGEYKCRAENDHGYKSIIIQLEYADAPTFIEPTVDLYLDNHRKGKFECKVDGVPYPKIRWMKDWRPVTESSRLKIHHTKPNQWSLHLSDVISLDGGLYTCVAENIAGKSMCSANLFVDDDSENEGEMETTIRPVIFRQAVFEDYFYVLEELGRGRHGVVRKVIEKSTGNVYAAKIIPACNENLKYFFGHELNNLRSFSNQRVPYVVDAFQSERQLIIVMELIKGKSLVEHILNQDTWCEYDVVCYIKQLLEILRTLHGSSIVHLDIKPSNIQMSTPDSDQIRLIDFGFSRHLSMDYDIKMNYGTEEFTSPEQIKNEPLTTAADMWSVGILTYILLSGVSPLRGEDDSDTLKKVLKGKINLSKDNFKVVSEDAKDFLAELLVVDPCDRLTVGECLQHPWIKEAADRGKGQLDLGHLSSFQARDTAQRKATYLRSVPRLQNLTSILQKTISTTTFTPSKDDKSGERTFPESEYFGEYLDEESWYDWQNRYHKGPGAKVVPLSETDYLARVRGSRPIRRVTDVDMDDDEETMKRTSVLEEEKVVHEDSCLQKELQYVVVADDVKQRKQASKDLFPKEDIKDENPQILSKFYDTAFTPGEEINLTCSLEISETPAVSWYRNEELVSDGSRVSIKIFGNGTTLTIFSAKPYDAGIYKCVVRSKGGKATAAARVLVGDVPNQPSRPVAMQVSSHQVMLLWEQPTSNGNSCVLGYRVDYRKTKERSWLTGSHPIDECTIISDLLPDTSYRFRVCAVNQFGSSAYSVASAEILTLPEGDDKIHLDEYTSAIIARQQGRINILPTPPAKCVVQLTEGSFNDKYDLVETVYSGKFSEFKIAKNISTGRTYGAKIISCTKDKMAAAKNEFEILRIMNQEMIVRLYDGFLFNEKLYFIMEYLYGVNVLQHFAFKTKYTEDMVAIVIRQVLEGVQYLQHVGVVHLNLQPSSIVMRSRRHLDLKITGFSHAQKISGNGEVVPCVGYPDFMAPEVVTREITSYPADIWTVGVLCFLLLSGESPFRGSDVEEIYSNVAYNRYDAHDMYENITRDALRFINRILKRISRNRLSLDECLDDKWLQVTDTTVKARQDSIFSTAKLRSFADLYRERGILGSWMPTESDLKEEPIREETDDKEKEEEVKPELTQKIEPEAASTPQAKDVEEDSPAPSPQSIAEKAEDSSIPSPQNVAAEGAGSPAPSPQSIADQGADCPAPSPQNIADQVAETVVTGAIEQALDSEELKK